MQSQEEITIFEQFIAYSNGKIIRAEFEKKFRNFYRANPKKLSSFYFKKIKNLPVNTKNSLPASWADYRNRNKTLYALLEEKSYEDLSALTLLDVINEQRNIGLSWWQQRKWLAALLLSISILLLLSAALIIIFVPVVWPVLLNFIAFIHTGSIWPIISLVSNTCVMSLTAILASTQKFSNTQDSGTVVVFTIVQYFFSLAGYIAWIGLGAMVPAVAIPLVAGNVIDFVKELLIQSTEEHKNQLINCKLELNNTPQGAARYQLSRDFISLEAAYNLKTRKKIVSGTAAVATIILFSIWCFFPALPGLSFVGLGVFIAIFAYKKLTPLLLTHLSRKNQEAKLINLAYLTESKENDNEQQHELSNINLQTVSTTPANSLGDPQILNPSYMQMRHTLSGDEHLLGSSRQRSKSLDLTNAGHESAIQYKSFGHDKLTRKIKASSRSTSDDKETIDTFNVSDLDDGESLDKSSISKSTTSSKHST